MKKNKVAGWLTLVIFWIFSVTAYSQTFLAGAGAADITPDLSAMKVPSSGYGERGPQPMQGVHDPVFCKVLVVADEADKAAIVTCDLIGISGELRAAVLEQIQAAGFDDRNLMMSATHTHSGPGAMNKNFIAGLVFGRYNQDLVDQTALRIGAAIIDADARKEPCTLRVAAVKLDDVTRNRRDPAGSYNYDTRRFSSAYDPDHPENTVDPELIALRFDAHSGRTIAVIINFASHATVLGADNLLISADWPGEAQRKVEAALPGTVALLMNGAIGDQAPAMLEDDRTDWEYVEDIGGKVAAAALAALEQAEPVKAAPVRAVMVRREVPPGNSVMGYRVPSSLIKRYFPEMPLQAVRLGQVVIMGAPVEMAAEIGLALKAGAKGQGYDYALVAGLANDIMLYCATPEDFERGGYEVDNTIFGKIEAGLIIGEQMLLVRQLRRE